VIERSVRGDAKEPRAEREALEGSDGPPRREERVLHDVLGIGRRADDAQRVPIERSLLSSRQILERTRISGACPLDE
jgi:hypothetical protein